MKVSNVKTFRNSNISTNRNGETLFQALDIDKKVCKAIGERDLRE